VRQAIEQRPQTASRVIEATLNKVDVLDKINMIFASGRHAPKLTELELWFTPFPGTVGVSVKLPRARCYEDLGFLSITD
jgi:hypothetical protein